MKKHEFIAIIAAALVITSYIPVVYPDEGSTATQVKPGGSPLNSLFDRAVTRAFGTEEERDKWIEGYEKRTTQITEGKKDSSNPIKEAAEGAAKATAKYLVVDVAVRLIFQYNVLYPWITSYAMSFPQNYEEAILANPSIIDSSAKGYNPEIANAVGYFIRLMLPFYGMAIVLTAAYILFMSASPEGLSKAKSLLKRLVASMIVLSMSPLIIEAMLVTSSGASSAIIGQADLDNVRTVLDGGIWGAFIIFCKLGITDLEVAIAFWTSVYVMAWLPYVVIGMRHIMMTLFCMVFPVGIALYSFVFLRSIGRKILEQTIVWIYMQAFLSVTILVISLGAGYYYIVPDEYNEKLTNQPLPIIMEKGVLNLLEWTGAGASMSPTGLPFQVINIKLGLTSMLAFSIGSMAYVLLVAVPFMMLRLLSHFLP